VGQSTTATVLFDLPRKNRCPGQLATTRPARLPAIAGDAASSGTGGPQHIHTQRSASTAHDHSTKSTALTALGAANPPVEHCIEIAFRVSAHHRLGQPLLHSGIVCKLICDHPLGFVSSRPTFGILLVPLCTAHIHDPTPPSQSVP
jgi:hypothetical protein